MSSSKSRLGKGLSGILSGSRGSSDGGGASVPVARKPEGAGSPVPAALQGFREVPVDAVDPNPFQPRKEIPEAAVSELADSIRAEGLLQPIVVRPVGERFQIIAGERRLRACQKLKFRKIPARVMAADDATSATLALIENLQRENLNPVEEAYGYASLIKDFELTQEEASRRVGKGRATIANALRLLRLSPELQGYLAKGWISVGHAKVLLGVEDEAQRSLLGRAVVERKLSVRETEEKIRRVGRTNGGLRSGGGPQPQNTEVRAALEAVEKKVARYLSAPVSVKQGKRRGRIVIEYHDPEDLDRILERMVH